MSTMRSKSRRSTHCPRAKRLGSPPLRQCLDLGGGARCDVREDLGFQGAPFLGTILSAVPWGRSSPQEGQFLKVVELAAMCICV
mmetsp:Transcript_48713/g.138265  ORF Transcript_48713/g.138265 Transcript_48713/m.138265 type:complete len:84 (+) Transcript_48713:1192-1443(+)